ncbi:MAG: CHAT domain-containing protein [Merismopedia sp. SIO2A8]|nr:CHAT domain-containing protein [Merismopedia sp. SIO2A8]
MIKIVAPVLPFFLPLLGGFPGAIASLPVPLLDGFSSSVPGWVIVQGNEGQDGRGTPDAAHDAAHQLLERGRRLIDASQRQEAIAPIQAALALYQENGDRQGEADALLLLGEIYTTLSDYEAAIAVLQPRLAIARQANDLADQSYVLGFLTQVYRLMGDVSAAIDAYQSAIDVAQARSLPEVEAFLRSDIAELLAEDGQTELAIAFYKTAINLREQVRQELRSLPPGFQEPYLRSVAYAYRNLADLLLQEDRVLEAQHVLDLLKVQELDDYLHDVRGRDRTTDALEFLESELRLLDLYANAVARGIEMARLREIPLGDRTSVQQQRLAELVAIEQEVVVSFDDFLDRADVVAATQQLSRTARRQSIDLEQLTALQDNLQALPNTVLLYPLVLDDRIELVLVTPYSPPIRRTVDVQRQELNQAIINYRQMLTRPIGRRIDLKAAQQLYDWLIRPIEDDIEVAQGQTILFAPDGVLRYIPMAALHDGEQWLVEMFQSTTITAASLTDFDAPPRQDLRVLAAAFSDGDRSYDVQVGTRQLSFVGLPYAGLEVDLIAAEIPQTTQVMDLNFSRDTIVPQMDDHTVVHLATHAEFVSGTPEDSFILFGNGDRITLRDMATWTLRNVDLVVLSACQTALGELGNGEEILGFGYQVQRTGARAAIASLWSVNDGGTQALMTAFYDRLKNDTPTKAEALQKAQLALLRGELSQSNSGVEQLPQQLPQPLDAYTHPYYWAPFILIGNSR